ncbi:replication initiation protein (plasmid) [Corynebacterium qintianiae]|uniref:Replication initiation protein n=1 Tax=Corynebacterium qintianiae TaxID=2709392 RepID=A0A7T0PGY9_9CORY|nr:replication initiation protein [Corynebacterium qintianiae]QPK84392.1 replication initiation protein [Corynebacterium qintianiae]
MTLPHSEHGWAQPAPTSVDVAAFTREQLGGLEDTPAGATDRDALISHLGRDVLHVSRDRNFAKAYRRTKDGVTVPLMWRTDSEELGKFQYAMLTNKQYAAVLVVDIDQPGTQGGHPINLAEELRVKLFQLVSRGLGPAWVGINRLSGKAQCLWLIDPVYADESGKSPHMALLAATSRTLGGFLDHDPNFAHRFSRSPFYTGDSPDRYIWYRQHHRIDRLSDFIREVREVTDEPQHVSPRQEFSSGRELIETVKARREQAQAFRAIADEIEVEMGEETDRYNPDLIDGVLVRWIVPGRAARDETAFRHALKTAHRLRAAGERMTDAAIIDAYERAYNIAQREGADGRAVEMPPMRDRQTMARRVRGYVTQGKTDSYGTPTARYATTSQRKALATMGRRGGKKAAKRWETDPEGEYAQNELKKLQSANKRRRLRGQSTRARVLNVAMDTVAQTGKLPSGREIAEELGVTKRTVNLHLKALREAGLLEID